VTIAFLDNGFYPHPELSNIVEWVDVTAERFQPSDFRKIRASSWHGTMVACAACGNGSYSNGFYRGLAPDASLVLIKVFDGRKIRSTSILRGLQWVLRHHRRLGIRVVNISAGGDRSEAADKGRIAEAVRELKQQGITVITAAGNNPSKPPVPPASCADALTVGGIHDANSTDRSQWTEYGTSHGRTADGHWKPDIVAPAALLPVPMLPDNALFEESMALFTLVRAKKADLKKTARRLLKKTRLPSSVRFGSDRAIVRAIAERMQAEKFFAPRHQHVDGTSFAAPIVASVVAQMLEANPSLTPGLIRLILQTTARPVAAIAREAQGYGMLDGGAAVEEARIEHHRSTPDASPVVGKDRITFYFHDHTARKVCLIGDFTAWQKDVILLHSIDHGLWRADLPLLAEGKYRYKYLLDDRRWIEDPANPDKENDRYNGLNSYFVIGPKP
jgi:serine protease AprX